MNRLPAYAKPLLSSRRAGQHPAVVTVVYGMDWRVDVGITRLAVKPGEALGLDWACVVGLPVELRDRSQCAESVDGELCCLAAEIAREAALVTLVTPFALTSACPPDGPGRADIALYAFLCRRVDPTTRRMAWPAWWSAELENLHGRNRDRWLKEIETHIARRAA